MYVNRWNDSKKDRFEQNRVQKRDFFFLSKISKVIEVNHNVYHIQTDQYYILITFEEIGKKSLTFITC